MRLSVVMAVRNGEPVRPRRHRKRPLAIDRRLRVPDRRRCLDRHDAADRVVVRTTGRSRAPALQRAAPSARIPAPTVLCTKPAASSWRGTTPTTSPHPIVSRSSWPRSRRTRAPRSSLAPSRPSTHAGRALVVRPPHWQPRLEWDLLFSNVVGAGAHVMFPRVFEGRPVSFPATHRYAEDYGMWCSLARRGRVVCPPDVVYRHRHHQTSISSSCRSEQDKCFALQRHEYQSLYLGAGISPSVCGDLAQFWGARGTLSLAEDLNRVGARLGELRAGFLGYVERRYGLADRGALERDLDEATVDRLAHWLTHAIRFKDGRTFRHLMALSSRMGLGSRVQSRLVAKIARSARRKLARTGAIARHASR